MRPPQPPPAVTGLPTRLTGAGWAPGGSRSAPTFHPMPAQISRAVTAAPPGPTSLLGALSPPRRLSTSGQASTQPSLQPDVVDEVDVADQTDELGVTWEAGPMPEISGISQEPQLVSTPGAGTPSPAPHDEWPPSSAPPLCECEEDNNNNVETDRGEETDDSSCQTSPTQAGRSSSTTTLWPFSPSRPLRTASLLDSEPKSPPRDGLPEAALDLDSDGAWHCLKAQVLALLKAAPPERVSSFEPKASKDVSPENKRESPHPTPRGARESPHREWLLREPKSFQRPATAARVGRLRDRNFFRSVFSNGLPDPPPTASPSKGLRTRTKESAVPGPAAPALVTQSSAATVAPAAPTVSMCSSVEVFGPSSLRGLHCPEDRGVSVAVFLGSGGGVDVISPGQARGAPQRARSDGRRVAGSVDLRAQDVFSSSNRGVQRARSDSRRPGMQRDALWNRDLSVMVALASPVGPAPVRAAVSPQTHGSSPGLASPVLASPSLASPGLASPGTSSPGLGPVRARSDGRRPPDERPSWPASPVSPPSRQSPSVKAVVPGGPTSGAERLRLHEVEAAIRSSVSELRFTPRAGASAQELGGRGRPPDSGRRVVASRA